MSDLLVISDSADFEPAEGPDGPGKSCITWTFAAPRKTPVGAGIYELRFVRILTAEERELVEREGVGSVLTAINAERPA